MSVFRVAVKMLYLRNTETNTLDEMISDMFGIGEFYKIKTEVI